MRIASLPVLLLMVAACGPRAEEPAAGQLAATWEGQERGTGRLDASAVYCARDSTLEILAHQGDRGIGVALHLAGSAPVPGRYTVVHPDLETVPRPAATGAYRALASDELRAFLSREGEVDITVVGPDGVSGTLALHLVSRSGPDSLVVRGTFRQVAVDSTLTPCGAMPRTPVEVF